MWSNEFCISHTFLFLTEIRHFFVFPAYATIFKSNHKCSFREKQKGGQLPAGSADDSVLTCMYWWLSVGTNYVRKQITFHKRTVQTSVSMHRRKQHVTQATAQDLLSWPRFELSYNLKGHSSLYLSLPILFCYMCMIIVFFFKDLSATLHL